MSAEKQVALITGANKGIGYEIARQLGAKGLTVLVGSRDAGRGEKAAAALVAEGIDACLIQLDVTAQSSIDAAAAFIEKNYGYLDVLVNNAGISIHDGNTAPSELSLAVFKRTFDTNVFGAFAVTQAMLPLIRKSSAGRIINVSSPMGSLSLHSDPESAMSHMPPLLAYCSSKTAMNALTVFFARELRETGIKVNSVSPGYVATDLNNLTGYLTPEQGAALPVKFALLPDDGPNGGFFEGEGTIPW